jgi:Gene product 88
MKISEILEGLNEKAKQASTPKLRGAFGATQVMSMAQFIAQAEEQEEEPVEEATTLNAPTAPIGGQKLQDYLGRIEARKKEKTDKYKLPYIHRSSVVKYYSPESKQYSEEAIKNALVQRPKKLLKQNEKMQHSNGELEQFFNIGFAALVGIAVDESANELVVVNTCPGAGSCKVDCFAMKGGKVQFTAPWLSDGRILTFLLNDPDGFFNKLSSEISRQKKLGDKGGYAVTIRWHDAGDFFSPEYINLAFKLAQSFPDVKFYAYTKMAGAVLSAKPSNFIINWSEGAHTSQEKQVKADDPELEQTKNSRIVPQTLFYDLLKKNEKGNLDKEGADAKGKGGRWQMRDPAALKELKQRLAKHYGISANSILSYDEWNAKNHGTGMKWNVIVAPGEGDISANSHDVLSTLLLKH